MHLTTTARVGQAQALRARRTLLEGVLAIRAMRCRRPFSWRGTAVLVLAVAAAALSATNLDLMQQLAQQRYGTEVARRVGEWRAMLPPKGGDVKELDKLESVNSFFNQRVRWVEDIELWNQNDYWATPLETLAKGAGDCEDFAIAKYVSLLLAGISEVKLRLTYVRLQQRPNAEPVAHMVLAYYAEPGSEPLIMDNVDNEVRPASRRSDLTPVYSFNASHLWVRGPQASNVDPTARISRWRDVLARMQAEHTL